MNIDDLVIEEKNNQKNNEPMPLYIDPLEPPAKETKKEEKPEPKRVIIIDI